MNPGNRILRPETLDLLREDLRLRLEAHPDWGDLWNLRGLLSAWEGDLEAARDAFATALERRDGERVVVNGTTSFLVLRGWSAADARVSSRSHDARSLPVAPAPVDVVYFVADPEPGAAP